MARTKRLRRKDIKQPDEFITLSSQVLLWLRSRPQLVTWGGVGILVVFVGILIGVAFRSARQRDSNADLGRAMLMLQTGKLSDAAGAFAEVAREWPSAPAGNVARILAADAELSKDNLDSAVLLIQQSLDSFSGMPEYLRQELLFGWGYALEERQDWQQAAEKYANAGSLSGPFSGPSVLGEARARQQAGETEAAQKLYAKYVEEYPDFPDHQVVKEKIGSLASEAATEPVSTTP